MVLGPCHDPRGPQPTILFTILHNHGQITGKVHVHHGAGMGDVQHRIQVHDLDPNPFLALEHHEIYYINDGKCKSIGVNLNHRQHHLTQYLELHDHTNIHGDQLTQEVSW